MPKQKSITELRDELAQLKTEASGIMSEARAAGKMLDDAQTARLGEIQCREAELRREIAEREFENRSTGVAHTPQRESFSLRRAILAAAEHQSQRDSEARVIEAATAIHNAAGVGSNSRGRLVVPFMQTRAAYTAGTEAQTGVVVDTDPMEMLLPLEPALVLSRAGVRMMTGLQGNIFWPKHSGVTVSWEGENAKAKDAGGEFTKGKTFSPKRLTAYVDISKQLLIQENMSVESLIRRLLAEAIAQKIEATAFGKHAHADTMPDGLFLTAPTAVTGAVSWANIVAMETKADLKNALFGNLAYILHPSLIGVAKTKVKDASGAGGFVFDGNGGGLLNGYRALRTNNIPSELQEGNDEFGIVFGNWADYFLGQWGAIDLTVDPYTKADEGMIHLVVNSYWDMGVIRDESFVIGSLK